MNQKMTVRYYDIHPGMNKVIEMTMPANLFLKFGKRLQEKGELHRIWMSENGTNTGYIITKRCFEMNPERFDSDGDPKIMY